MIESRVLLAVQREIESARFKHPKPMNSAHEAFAVLLEEVDEVKAEVWKRKRDENALREELIQVAAVACRAIQDLGL